MEYDAQTLSRLWQVETEILGRFIEVCKAHGITYFAVFGTAIGAERHGGFIPWDDDLDIGMMRSEYERFLQVVDEMGPQYELVSPLTDPDYACSVIHIQKKGTLFLSEDDVNCKTKKGINMDIFVYDSVSDDAKESRRQYRKSYLFGRLLFLTGRGKPCLPFGGLKAVACRMIFFLTRVFLRLLHITGPTLYRRLEAVAKLYNDRPDTEYVTSFCSPWAEKERIRRTDLFPTHEIPFEHLMLSVPYRDEQILNDQYGDFRQLPPVEQRVTHRPAVIAFGEDKETVLTNG